VRAYRGGYLPLERRAIEQDLFAGRLRAVAATNALELGLDIGSLDVAILAGYPGTIASTWQQAGRSGRRHDESLAVLIAGNDPVDQYLLRHPDYFFRQTPEQAVVDPENPYVLARHLKTAAFEIPLGEADVERFGTMAQPIIEALRDAGDVTELDGQYFFAGSQNPTVGVSLRHMSDNTFSIVLRKRPSATGSASEITGGSPLGTHTGRASGTRSTPSHQDDFEVIANVDSISAPELVYPQAVYLHNGESYFVRELDLEGKVAYVERHEMDYYTQAVLESAVKITRPRDERADAAGDSFSLAYGDVDVTWQTVAFKKIKFGTRENIGQGPVDIPSQTLATTAFWLCPADDVRRQMKTSGLRTSEGLVGLRNLAVVAIPLVAMCDSRDLGGVVDSTNLGQSTLILYDRYPGGLGYCERGFARIDAVLSMCHEMLADCECEEGCPSCVGLPNLRPAIHSDPDLSRGYPIPNKRATLRLIEILRGGSELGTTSTAHGSRRCSTYA
jgi:DEAD/DEAH box helicase domain-containing protein